MPIFKPEDDKELDQQVREAEGSQLCFMFDNEADPEPTIPMPLYCICDCIACPYCDGL